MFELNAAICSWRLSFGDSMREEDVDELEEHLRAELEVLRAKDLSEEEAFLVSRRRIGSNGELESEFAKVHVEAVWIGRVQWMVLGFLGINALVSAVGLIAQLTGLGANVFGLGSTATVGAQALAQFAGLAVLLWIFYRVVRHRLSEGRPLVQLSLLLALAVPLLLLGGMVTTLGAGRVMAPEDMGYAMMYSKIVGMALAILLPLALFLAVYLLEGKRRAA